MTRRVQDHDASRPLTMSVGCDQLHAYESSLVTSYAMVMLHAQERVKCMMSQTSPVHPSLV